MLYNYYYTIFYLELRVRVRKRRIEVGTFPAIQTSRRPNYSSRATRHGRWQQVDGSRREAMRQQRVSHERPSCLRWHRFWGVRPQRVLRGSRAMLQMSPMPLRWIPAAFSGPKSA